MTKKDYIVIAGVLNKSLAGVNEDLRTFIIDNFCYELEKQNPRFDGVKFKQAINA